MRRAFALMASFVCVAALAACGSSGGGGGSKGGFGTGEVVKGKKGGTLTVLSNGDVDYIDPGAAYYQFSFIFDYAMQRPLFSYKPGDQTKAVPDFAASPAQISPDGKTITIKVRQGVKFSPPVNRVATSKDSKFAIERGFNSTVANGYAPSYFATIVGADQAKKKADGGPISGLQTPDDQTLVIKLTRPNPATVIGALSLPLSAPVPKEYAAKFDKKNPSQYGQNLVATGPYMVQNNAAGKATGYQPGKQITFVRNPNWDAATDYRPAYLDKIVLQEGNTDGVSAARRILTGQSLVNGQADFNIPPQILKQLSTAKGDKKKQLVVGGNTGRVRYISLNNTIKPFNDINVRKAIAAAMNREFLRQPLGGPLAGDIPTHYISPGILGFEQAGGFNGPGVDFLKDPKGNADLAAQYMKKAGYSSGKYDGGGTFLMVADNSGPTAQQAQVAKDQFEKLGFKINLRPVTHDTMYTKFCNVPKQKVPICPSTGWQKDFPDPVSVLVPTFNGNAIVPVNNSNWPQLNVKAINDAMDKAEELTADQARAKAWGDIDKQITDQSPAIPWLWDKTTGIQSTNVLGVINKFNASWDLSFTSLS
jgi:peptide/nickel transport system substrate-binding protein